MSFNNKQIEDLERKLGQVEEVIGFPINKRQLEQVELMRSMRNEIIGKQKERGDLPIPIYLRQDSVESIINLFEEYLNEES